MSVRRAKLRFIRFQRYLRRYPEARMPGGWVRAYVKWVVRKRKVQR